MKKTVCELFAGVGGFRCGLNNIKTSKDYGKKEKWDTVWFSQWEPAEKKTQYAHDCYVYRFGTCLDKNGEDTTNYNIEEVDKSTIPDFNLLVGGFPCQDYSVASSLATSKGLEGKKGILWWSIRETVEKKQPPFCLRMWIACLNHQQSREGEISELFLHVSEMKDIQLNGVLLMQQNMVISNVEEEHLFLHIGMIQNMQKMLLMQFNI